MLNKRVITAFFALATAGWIGGIQMANAQSKDQLVDKYATLAGSEANANTLVNGLSSGSDFTINGTTFKTPTGKMGGGEVNNALLLTQYELQKQGITNPTTAQLQTALNDVLTQRASGKGWGEIANAMGIKLGDLRRNEKATEHARDISKRDLKREGTERVRADRPDRADKPERPERGERPDRPERAGR